MHFTLQTTKLGAASQIEWRGHIVSKQVTGCCCDNCYFAGSRCETVMSMSLSLSPSLSACISRKPRGRTSPNFCACCLCPWLGSLLVALQYTMYFRFCGWHHVFTQWSYGGSCIFLSDESIIAETAALNSLQCFDAVGWAAGRASGL